MDLTIREEMSQLLNQLVGLHTGDTSVELLVKLHQYDFLPIIYGDPDTFPLILQLGMGQ